MTSVRAQRLRQWLRHSTVDLVRCRCFWT